MKTTAKQICSFLLLLPGAYAITRWSLMDYRDNMGNPEQRASQYLSVFPMLHLGFTQLLLCLLIVSATGTLFVVPSLPAAGKRKKVFRILLLIMGSAETALLLFSLM